jgi:hypothetical protein
MQLKPLRAMDTSLAETAILEFERKWILIAAGAMFTPGAEGAQGY